MATKLSEMSLEELWQLFPIVLTEHREEWAQWYEEERDLLSSMLPGNALFYHIGSTAIDNIWAKPIVDILIEFPSVEAMQKARDILASNGYLLMCEDAARISFNKGYTENGFAVKVFHIHLRIAGDNDEILFRDYMNAHPEEAEEYDLVFLKDGTEVSRAEDLVSIGIATDHDDVVWSNYDIPDPDNDDNGNKMLDEGELVTAWFSSTGEQQATLGFETDAFAYTNLEIYYNAY